MNKAAHRAGYNRGSADKISGRDKSRYVPAAYQDEKTSYRRGYKKGYDKTGAAFDDDAVIINPIVEAVLKRVDAEIPVRNFDYRTLVKTATREFVRETTRAPKDTVSEEQRKKIARVLGPLLYKKVWDAGTPQDLLQTISYMEIGARNASEVDAVRREREEEAKQTGLQTSTPVQPAPSGLLLKPFAFKGKLALSSATTTTATTQTESQQVKDRAQADALEKSRKERELYQIEQEKQKLEEQKKLAAMSSNMQTMSLIGPATPIDSMIKAKSEPQPESKEPSWFSKNWWIVALGAVAVGGGTLLYMNRKNM